MINKAIGKLLLTFLLFISATASASPVIWIDVRTSGEYLQEHVTGAINIQHTEIAEQISSVVSEKDSEIYLYCGSGRRAGIAKDTLEALGYTQVKNIGGINDALAKEQSLK
jgi:phage shock protein E